MAEAQDVLFDPFMLGDLQLPNRILMAPLTRSRAQQPGDIPWELNATYYAQRASAGLIIAEATQVSPQGKGYAFTPGIHSDEQVEGWQKVTSAVHQAGGRIYLQLWHVGRISRPELQPNGQKPIAPSAIRPQGAQTFIDETSGMVDVLEPRALASDEIPGLVDQFRRGAENAQRAGFDGVEIHGANGYLIDQFIRSKSNQRSDAYGGSIENRIRFPMLVVDAVVDVWGGQRTGIRLSPTGTFNDMHDADPVATFGTLARRLSESGIAFIEVVEDSFQGNEVDGRPESVISAIRSGFAGTYIGNGNYSVDEARTRIQAGLCDLVSFGRPFISNPDLPERFRHSAPLAEYDPDTFYGGDAHGYTDYPALA
jgi:N-ethylmaleimide reductase